MAMAPLRILAVLAAAYAAAGKQDVPLPIYCRMLQSGLVSAKATRTLMQDIDINSTQDVPLLGNMFVDMHHITVGSLQVRGCSASIGEENTFHIAVTDMVAQIAQFDWSYWQERWPHENNNGIGNATAGVSFSVSVNLDKDEEESLDLSINDFAVVLGGVQDAWLEKAMISILEDMRPLVSKAVEEAARLGLKTTLENIRTKGGCAVAEGSMADMAEFNISFKTPAPMPVHVPLVGEIGVSVNSTKISLPTSMACRRLSFTGTNLSANVEELSFLIAFDWAYSKPSSNFWDRGTGLVDTTIGAVLYIDVLDPNATSVEVDMPKLKLQLHAERVPDWLYNAIERVVTPLIHGAVADFAGTLLQELIKQCLEDATCPRASKNIVVV